MFEDRLESDGRRRDRSRAAIVLKGEMETNTSLSPVYAWSKRGQRDHCLIPHHGEPNTMLLARMMVKAAMGPFLNCRRYDHCSRLWNLYRESERVPIPSLQRGQLVMIDNLLPHKCERARKLVESADCELLQRYS